MDGSSGVLSRTACSRAIVGCVREYSLIFRSVYGSSGFPANAVTMIEAPKLKPRVGLNSLARPPLSDATTSAGEGRGSIQLSLGLGSNPGPLSSEPVLDIPVFL